MEAIMYDNIQIPNAVIVQAIRIEDAPMAIRILTRRC
jgi:hypothetical protein